MYLGDTSIAATRDFMQLDGIVLGRWLTVLLNSLKTGSFGTCTEINNCVAVCLGDTSIAATRGFMQLDAIVLGRW